MPRRNEKPTHIGFKSQEGDRGLQEGDRSLGWDGGAGDILLRGGVRDRKSTRLNSSHSQISYAVFCLKIKIQHVGIGRRLFEGRVRRPEGLHKVCSKLLDRLLETDSGARRHDLQELVRPLLVLPLLDL